MTARVNKSPAGDAKTAPGHSPFIRRKSLDLWVGLDFGTSSTKAAFREIGTGSRRIRPLLFDHDLADYLPFCLPAIGAVSAAREFVWGADAVRLLGTAWYGAGIQQLKVLIAGGADPKFRNPRAIEDFAAYLRRTEAPPSFARPELLGCVALAWQISEVLSILRKRYAGTLLDVRFNVNVPIDQVESSVLLQVYHRMAHVAEQLLEQHGEAFSPEGMVDQAAALWDVASPQERRDGRIFVVPESVAQIACYLSSLEAVAGVYAVIDVGAGTTDLSIFHLQGPSTHEARCYWYSAQNIPQGAAAIEDDVADYLRQIRPSASVSSADVRAAVAAAQPGSEIRRLVEGRLAHIRKTMNVAWACAYGKYRRPSVWREVPVFLGGGGSQIPGLPSAFRPSWIPAFGNHAMRALPHSRDYDEEGHRVPFDRLSVAVGLTFPRPELSEYVLPNDVKDGTPPLTYGSQGPPAMAQPFPRREWN
jgi:hypothetical protein